MGIRLHTLLVLLLAGAIGGQGDGSQVRQSVQHSDAGHDVFG